MGKLLEVEGMYGGYGRAVVLEQVSFSMPVGGSLALLGRNGMGKSTLLTTLMGVTPLHRGQMRFKGQDLATVAPHHRARMGIGWVPQERDIFRSLTVEENLTSFARPGHWTLARVYAAFPRLAERKKNMGNQLSGGEQQMLAMARALMLNPALLLLDEPLEGLAPIIVQELLEAIRRMLADGGIGVILVEQHARQILPLTREALVLERGRSVFHGPSQDLIDAPDLLDQWLGVTASHVS
jgi:branched-chain amino acid transport system ATP-binding protein